MSKKLKPLAALVLVSPLTACSGPTAVIDSSCKSFSTITWSKADTDKTKRQVWDHNKAWEAICK